MTVFSHMNAVKFNMYSPTIRYVVVSITNYEGYSIYAQIYLVQTFTSRVLYDLYEWRLNINILCF